MVLVPGRPENAPSVLLPGLQRSNRCILSRCGPPFEAVSPFLPQLFFPMRGFNLIFCVLLCFLELHYFFFPTDRGMNFFRASFWSFRDLFLSLYSLGIFVLVLILEFAPLSGILRLVSLARLCF